MSDINKSLRVELLSEYEILNSLDKVSNTEEAVLLRQVLIEDYNYTSDDSQLINVYKFKDEEFDSEGIAVKTLTEGRHV